MGARRMNSRERRKIWRKVKQLMEEEERERGVEKRDAGFNDEVQPSRGGSGASRRIDGWPEGW